MALISPIKDNDWPSVRKAFAQLASQKLGVSSSPTFGTITVDEVDAADLNISSLTASKLIASDASKDLVSTDLSSWTTGTANQITITDDGDGTITLSLPQDIATASSPQFARLYIDDTNTYIDSDGSNNMTFTDAIVGTRTLKQIGCPVYHYIKATTQSEGDLHLTDTTWTTSKALIKTIRVITSSTDWDLFILQNDNGYAANDADFPRLQLVDGISGNATLRMNMIYEDEDDSDELHLYWVDNSGSNTADFYIKATELL